MADVSVRLQPALERPDLLAPPVAEALNAAVRGAGGPAAWAANAKVAEIDPEVADTESFCARYGVLAQESANCVVIAARRGQDVTLAACVVLATTRADVNGLVRRHLGARKASFAPMDIAVGASGMEYGGITPVGLPPGWPVLIDQAVTDAEDDVVVGSGLRRSKLWLPGRALADLPGAEVVEGLGVPR